MLRQVHTVREVVGGRISYMRTGHGRKLREYEYVWRTEFLAVGSLEKINFLSRLSSGGN